jgi:hypothetical protein
MNFETKLVKRTKKNNKCFFSYISNKLGKGESKIGPLKNDYGNEIVDDERISNELNNYFSTVFTKPIKSTRPEVNIARVNDNNLSLSNIEINEDIITKLLNHMKINKSPGIDDLSSTFLIKIKDVIVKPLTRIFQRSFESGLVPEDWKSANITPLFKKGSKAKVENYRPISLTSQLGKLFEKMVKDQINEYLNVNQLIGMTQHGFREGNSCETNLIEFTDYVTKNLDSKIPIDVIYLDFSKAFDKVPHAQLVTKLKSVGITGKLLNWISNWLSNRKQRVICNGSTSKWKSVLSGVPQGSVLGPLLFTIYINDLEDSIKSKLLKFADDTKLIGKVGTVTDIIDLKGDLQKLEKWSKTWLLPFNYEKCKVLHFGKNNPNISYTFGDKDLQSVDEERDLGIIVTKDGKVEVQCGKVAKKANKILGLICRNLQFKSLDNMLTLYKTLVRPILEYCITAWRPYLKKDIVVLEKVQKRFSKKISECKNLSYVERLKKIGLTSFEKRCTRSDLILAYKIIVKGSMKSLSDLFILNSSSTRGHKYKLYKKFCRTELRKNSFGNRVIDTWNSLPEEVVLSDNINTFKGRLSRFLGQMGDIV